MTRARSTAFNLVRLLDASPLAVYAIDDARRIVYCNPACAQWVGVSAESLVGVCCDYHSAPTGDAVRDAACRLCPPPARFEGGAAANGATYIPLAPDADGGGGLVAILSLGDGAATPQADCDEAARLHEAIARFRDRQARTFPLDRLMGESPAMVKARAQALLAAESAVAVTLCGPPGSGRKHLASTIHYAQQESRRGNLVPLDCGLVDADLLDVSLDMILGRVSRERNETDTILLLDAHRLSADGQSVLADFLGRMTTGVRVLATSDALLERREGFRRDLAAALGTITIELPPLRARLGDLPQLAQLLLEDLNALGGKQVAGFAPEALDALAQCAWPGEIDELAETVRQAHARAEHALVAVDDLPQRLHQSLRAASNPRRIEQPIDLAEVLRNVETELIDRAMLRAKGNKAKAARMLGIGRARLLRRIEQLGLTQWNRAPQ
jgi:DNA-binding NtrC family response regulator